MLEWMRKFRFLIILLMIILYCLVAAINAQFGDSTLPDAIFGYFFLATILVTMERKRTFFFGMLSIFTLKIIISFSGHYLTKQHWHALQALVIMLFCLFMMIMTHHLTRKESKINLITLFGSLSSYLFMGLAFAYMYLIVYIFFPADFSGLQPFVEIRSIYYSFIILTTVGFSDVVAHNPLVQTLSWIEAFLGQTYMMLFISRLLGHYISAEIRAKNLEARK